MSVFQLSKYSVDGSGTNPTNNIVDEPHVLNAIGGNDILMREGIFYTKGFSVRAEGSSAPLVPGTDYKFEGFDPEATAYTGLEVAGSIVLTNAQLYGTIYVTYNAVGGSESKTTRVLENIEKAITAALGREVDFNSLKGKPVLWTPGEHDHRLQDLIELDPIPRALKELASAFLGSRTLVGSAEELRNQDERTMQVIGRIREDMNMMFSNMRVLQDKYDVALGTISTLRGEFDAHLANHTTVTVIATETDSEGVVTTTTTSSNVSDSTDTTSSGDTASDSTDNTSSDSSVSDSTDTTSSGDTASDSTDTASSDGSVSDSSDGQVSDTATEIASAVASVTTVTNPDGTSTVTTLYVDGTVAVAVDDGTNTTTTITRPDGAASTTTVSDTVDVLEAQSASDTANTDGSDTVVDIADSNVSDTSTTDSNVTDGDVSDPASPDATETVVVEVFADGDIFDGYIMGEAIIVPKLPDVLFVDEVDCGVI